ncbi:MAG: CocE/NonD family hydrolase [Solirubrobacteraceae bacterium]
MRDGVVLRANVYRPDRPGRWPVLLARTPYGKDLPDVSAWLDPIRAARQGFIVVVQDTRGRFSSDGDWEPFRFERADGYDTVEWAAALPGASGRVGMYGMSYYANTQWLAAVERPPSLMAIAPAMTWSEPLDGLLARGGAVELGLAVPWSLQQGFDYLTRQGDSSDDLNGRVDALIDECDRLPAEGYWELPVSDATVFRRHSVPDIGSSRASTRQAAAGSAGVAALHERVDLPTLHLAGWYDLFLQGTLDNYQAVAGSGHDCRLIVGPWTHARFADGIGELTFGIRSGRDAGYVYPGCDWTQIQLAWFRQHLTAERDVELPGARVRIFVMGRNEWRDESEWPPAQATRERWFLRSCGRLTLTPSTADESPSEFSYDPDNPVPSTGGNTFMAPSFGAGPLDQRPIESRADVLAFTSEPLTSDLEVTGPVRVVLGAQSSAPATDWVARLCDVDQAGRSVTLCDGIVRVADGAQRRRRYEVDLWSTSNVFLSGHALRVHVTSSSFPRWDRNLNTGNQGAAASQCAQQTIFHHGQLASYIELSVV